MRPIDVLQAIAYPLTSATVLVPLLVFWILISFALWGGLLGAFLLFLVIPAVFRFQVIVLEARARGVEPETPGAEFFNWFGNAWTLFPVPLSVLLVWLVIATGQRFGETAAGVAVFLASTIFPASLAVLAITHSPLQSVNPVAITRLLGRCGGTLWVATAFLSIASGLAYLVDQLPAMLATLAWLVLSFSFFSLVGSLIEPYGLVDDIYMPLALEKSAAETQGDIEKIRVAALGHAYGFISRDNRAGGFDHIMDEIKRDPDPARAWAWYFDQMMGWENKQHAMFFAQHYVADMLAHGEEIPALKAIMRCRLIDAAFRPFPDDMARAISAAERSGNIELAAVLKQG